MSATAHPRGSSSSSTPLPLGIEKFVGRMSGQLYGFARADGMMLRVDTGLGQNDDAGEGGSDAVRIRVDTCAGPEC